MPEAKIGIMGGTGLYEIEGLSDVKEVRVETPFGDPSDSIIVGRLEGTSIAFLPRHGRGHRINPTELPSRANIYALKSLGVERIISINSAGSLKEELAPRHLVIPDQIIDRTRNRVNSFFGDGLVVHIPFAEPFCPVLSEILHQAARDAGATVHKGGTFIAMEGPQFSTRAESRLYRSWGGSIIGMTILPEAKLAREAEICYASVACVTDYDCWHEEKEPVTAEIILAVLAENTGTAKEIIKIAAPRIPGRRDGAATEDTEKEEGWGCECASALMTGIVTPPGFIPQRMKRELALLIGKYLK